MRGYSASWAIAAALSGALAGAGAVPVTAEAAAQTPRAVAAPSASPLADRALVKQVVDQTVEAVERFYLYADKRPPIIARLRQSHAAGRYDGGTMGELAGRLTEDLQAVTSDLHMGVSYQPEALALRRAAPQAGQGGPDGAYLEEARASNQGIAELKILPGNVRYMKLSVLYWVPEKTSAAYDHAASFLRDGDAVIVDFSEVPGGSPAAVRYLVSHFMEPGRKLMTYISAIEGESESRSEAVRTGRITKPALFISGPRSGSAAEELAAHVKNFKLGTMIGGTTAGAGNRNVRVPTDDGFEISVSTATALHAVTNLGWEGSGIAPDVATPPSKALATAHLAALKAVRAAAVPARHAALDRLIENAGAMANPHPLSPAAAQALVGSYGSERAVSLNGASLRWNFGTASFAMLPISDSEFVLDGQPIRLRFIRQGERVVAVEEVGKATRRIDRTT